MSLIDDVLTTATQLAPSDKRRVIRELSQQLDRHLEELAETAPELPGQVSGYWWRPEESVPVNRPAYDPTGALLPLGGTLTDQCHALDLVQLDGVWFVLSESGMYTYSHSRQLARGGEYLFIPVSNWGAPYQVKLARLSEPGDVYSGGYPEEIKERMRPDRKVVTLSVQRVHGDS